jgi:hypothetical protein
MDDWGAFTAVGKKKKGKKGAEPEIPPPPPAPEPVDLAASGTADGGDDDWTGFSTGKKKKSAKKGKVRVHLFHLPWRLRGLGDNHMHYETQCCT